MHKNTGNVFILTLYLEIYQCLTVLTLPGPIQSHLLYLQIAQTLFIPPAILIVAVVPEARKDHQCAEIQYHFRY